MSNEVIIEELYGQNGLVGCITLNRPQALNALTENMCQEILSALEKWDKNSEIQFAIIKGAGEKAFCAGGDIKQVYFQGKETRPDELQPFFIAEYAMNKALHHFKKPYIAFLNGITMGGGVGVSLHGSHRIATEKLRFAMPETAIGFYPDVGAGFHLVRCPKKFGWYLALTGNTIGPLEALHFGLCTHYIPDSEIQNAEDALITTADIHTLKNFTHNGFPAYEGKEGGDENSIERIFTAENLNEVLKKLESAQTPFAKNTLDILRQRSPLSLKVTWEHLKHCEKLSFDEVMQENYVLTQHFLRGHDFYEGVRAQIIDKDKNPHWKPNKLSEIPESEVIKYFLDPEALPRDDIKK